MVKDVTVCGPDPSQSLEEQWIRWRVAQTGSVLWRRHSLQQIGGWNEQYPCCQDNEVTLRAIRKGLTFEYCPDAGAVYRVWSDETVCRKDPSKVIQFKTKLIDEMLEWLDQTGDLTTAHSSAAGQAFFEMARSLAKSDLAVAQDYVTKRIGSGPFRAIGPAAPRQYKLLFSLIGFKATEIVAKLLRRSD